ncbi:COX15/CtaA family protein [Lutibaculum baratangense]|uniref:Heme A synthase n=1 Tax=Lutibaculum baratangense AMV1 TaxID=631454 RepID=V4QU41_9HYPH|nr:COX15/CtaA family protein [Lutibaculum baratangense]ESR23292.1 Heme A synthase, cytochrome oxidase biogenesis protein Cox15-CtaA [Lutibaculum baratangense AMV1]
MSSQTPSLDYVPMSRAERARPAVRAWLLVVALFVLAMVVVGGATRLTESGLSITEWNVVTGALPPLSEEAWEEELEKYRQIPQYQEINRGMSMEDFQFIYYWEWGHRLLGRIIGFLFLIPFLFFLFTGRLERRLVWPLTGLFVLGGLQGALGWYMVMSGLVERVSVSQYRLAAHLGLAAAIFALLIWVAQGLRNSYPERVSGGRIRATAWVIVGLVLLQVLVGGLVAGLDAGFVYQTWPLMDGSFAPDGLMFHDPWWINFFENIGTVQFEHRMVGYLILAVALLHLLDAYRSDVERSVRRRAHAIAGMVFVQIALGVATLLTGVNLWIALLHQAGAIVVLFLAVTHARDLHDAVREQRAVRAVSSRRIVAGTH